jgi:hypothetical protein
MITQIIDRHSNTLADLADSVGINYSAIRPYLHQQTGSTPITRGIHKNAKYRGKVYCFIKHWTAPDGTTYPTITFGTHRHGGITQLFNAYREEMAARGYSDSYICKQQPRQPKQEYIAPIESLEQWQITALAAAKKAFDAATNENVSTHDYVAKKGLDVEDCDIRRGIGKYGDCLMIAVVNAVGTVIGYQQIYAQNIKGKDTNKYFIGRTGGGFVVIGDKSQIKNGAIFCEGLATGLKTYHSNGATKGELQNNRQMPVVVCLSAGNMRTVVADFVAEHGAKNFKIYADNDCGKEAGNTGIFTALEICKENGIKKYRVPVSGDGAACDFADTLKFQDFVVPKNRIDYVAELLKVCPKPLIARCWKRYAYALIENAPSELRSVDDCVNAVIAVTRTRGINVEKMARDLIGYEFEKRKDKIRKQKTITDFNGIERWNVDDKTPADVAMLITMHNKFTQTMHFDNRGMGGNKTNTMVERAKYLTGGIAYISPLVSVCKNAGDRLDFYDYQSTSVDFVNSYSHRVNLSICINSITKYNLSQNFSHIFIDEAAAVYAAIFDDTGTNSKQQATLIKNLREAFQAAQSILIADAGLSDVEVAFFKSLAGNKRVCLIETTPKLSDKNHWLLKNHSHAHELIMRDISNGKCGVIACDSVAAARGVYKYLKNHGIKNKISIDRVLLATGENCGEENVSDFIEKPNENAYLYDVVIHSPIIRSGTSIEYGGYSFTYLLYDGVIGTSDAMQMIGRNRCATDVYVSFGSNADRTRVTDFEALLNADIESHLNQGYVLADEGLARLRHQFTVNKNADLNDYKNNFMLFAEITGRNFIRIETDIELDKKFNATVKDERVEDRLNARILNKSEYHDFKDGKYKSHEKANIRTTQAEHDAIKRYETAIMVYGEENITSDSVITSQDIENEMDGMTEVLEKFELISTDTEKLKELDKADSDNDCLKYSRVQLQNALNDVLKPVLAANEKGSVNRKDFNKTCDRLEKHAPILALAGLGNYKKINRIRTGATVGNFVEKIGYRIKEIGQKGTGKRERIFEIKQIDDISRYAMNRKGYS